MSASAKLYLSLGINYIPQMDFATQENENGGVSASQSFLIRKANVGSGSALANFKRGTRLEVIDPGCPALYRNLTLKEFPIADHAPGMMRVDATFTGYAYSANGSSGTEPEVPTTSLAGSLEEAPISEHKKWATLSKNERLTLGKILSGLWYWIEDPFAPGEYVVANLEDDGDWNVRTSPSEKITSEVGKIFAQIISEGDQTYKKPSWNYSYRTNSKTGFTSAQLATLGHIVNKPPGNPVDPGTGYTWLSVGPSQEQSGPDLFSKELPFMLIEDNEKNQFLYGD